MPSTRIQTPNNNTVKKQFSGLKSKPKPRQPVSRRPPLPNTKAKTNKLIRFSIDGKDYNLRANNTLKLETMCPIISINSNCMFFRPTIFSYKGEYIDVHHS